MKKGAYQQLNLTHLEAALPQVLEAAQREQWTYETFLERALAAELEGREQKAIARRLKAARIPSKKTVDGFDFAFQPTLSERRLRELADLSFVRTCANVVFLSPPSTGKPISVWHWRTERSPPAFPCCLPPWLNWRKHWRVLRILVSCASVSGGILLPTCWSSTKSATPSCHRSKLTTSSSWSRRATSMARSF